MSKEITGEVLDYPYGLFLMERLEFVLLCEDDIEAHLLRIVEVWMQQAKMEWLKAYYAAIEAKKPPPPEPARYWVSISHLQFLSQLYKFDTADVGAKHPNSMSVTTLRRRLNALIDKGFLLVRSQPGKEYDATQYTINCKVVQEAMNRLPQNPYGVFIRGRGAFLEPPPPSNLEPPTFQKETSSGSNLESPQVPKSNPLIYPVIDQDNNQEKKDSVAVSGETRNAPAHSVQEDFTQAKEALGEAAKHLERITDKHKAVTKGVEHAALPAADDSRALSLVGSALEAATMPAPARGLDRTAVPAPPGNQPDSRHDGTARSQQATNTSKPGDGSMATETQVVEQAVLLDGQSAPSKQSRKRKDATQDDLSAPPQMPPEAMPWGTRKCLLKFDALRGVTLISRHKLMQASQCAKGLTERYSEAYTFVAQEVMSDDRYYAGRFVDVCDVANNIHKYKAKIEKRLKEVQARDAPQDEDDFGHSDFDSYVGNGPEERRALYERGLAMAARGEIDF